MGSVWELNAPSNGLPMLLIDGVFNGSYKFFLSGFSTGYFHVKIFALGRSVSLIFFFYHADAKLAPKHCNIFPMPKLDDQSS